MTLLGNMQFYGLMVELENYHRSNYDRISFQQEIIRKFNATIACHWNEPKIVFSAFSKKDSLTFGYNFVSVDVSPNENLLEYDSYFNVSMHYNLPPPEHLIRFSRLIDVGFGIVLPWNI